MLHGLVIFHEGTGALLFQKRFTRSFGLPGAAKQPSIADPVGLALQLYAFNKFCSGVREASKLEYLCLGSPGNSVSFACASLLSVGSGELPVVLALFGTLPQDLGRRLATSLLQAFVTEHEVRPYSPASGTSAEPGAPRCGVSGASGAGTNWRFVTLEKFLGSIPDLLVGTLADHLPRVTPWLMLLFTSPSPVSSAAATAAGSVREPTKPAEATAPTPRPPAEPPSARHRASASRPHLARRMLQRLPGGSIFSSPGSPGAQAAGSQESTMNTPLCLAAAQTGGSPGFDGVLSEAPHGGSQKTNTTYVPVRPASVPPGSSLAQGKLSWWRRNRSKSASRASDTPITSSVCSSTATTGAAAQQVSTVCYFYDADGASGGEETQPGLMRFADTLRRASTPKAAAVTGAASSMVLVLGAEELPSGIHAEPTIQGPDGALMDVVVLGSALAGGGWLSVAMPASVLLPPPPSSLPTEPVLEVARAARRCLEPELATLGAYLTFLDASTTSRSALSTAAGAPGVPRHRASSLRC